MTVSFKRGDSRLVAIPVSDRVTVEVAAPFTATYRMAGDTLTVRFHEPRPKARISFGVEWRQAVEGLDVTADTLTVRLPGFPDRTIPL